LPINKPWIEEVAAWENDRNTANAKASWQFSTQNARIKLKHLYLQSK